MGVCWCCPWERLVCDYRLCSLLFGLEVVFVRPCWVPSLALLAALCMVHFAPVILPITNHTDFCQQRNKIYWNILFSSNEWQQKVGLLQRNKPHKRWLNAQSPVGFCFLTWTWVFLSESYCPLSYPLNTVVCHTPQLVRWGLWCSTMDHQDHCLDSDRSSPSGLALGTYRDKTYTGVDRHHWKC